jgi:aminoglycoside phosphotransferase (APT) family kinase protein
MCAAKRMHADEVEIDDTLVRRLLATQFPQWAELPLDRVRSAGTVNAIYRLGDELSVRLPLIPGGVDDVDHEHRWLPRLADRLPLAVPVPVAMGSPAAGFPFPWTVCRWVDGEHLPLDRLADPRQAALDLAGFVAAMRLVDPVGAPPAARQGALSGDDEAVRASIAAATGLIDTDAVTAAWDTALPAPEWDGRPVWLHGDLLPGNLLATDGRLSGVIDFGCAGVGDPAWDVIPAWTYLDAGTREVFRAELDVDDATWDRARGWVVRIGILALPYYRDTNPEFAAVARRMLDEVLADLGLASTEDEVGE